MRKSLALLALCTALLCWGGRAALHRDTAARGAANPVKQHAASPGADPAGVRAALAGLHLVNYYPAANAQTNLWLNWQPAAIDADFARLAAMNANAVRVALFVTTFGYPFPSEEMLAHFSSLLDMADAHGLRVEVALFGFWTRYDDVDGSRTWAQSVLAPFRGDPRIALVDVQNELDVTNARALSWAAAVVPAVKEAAGSIPVTVSVSNTAGVSGLQQLAARGLPLDFYDLHYYGLPQLAYVTFQNALAAVAPAPLFIGEAGYSTDIANRGGQNVYDQSWWEAYQDRYHRTVQYAARALGLPAVAPWIMYDFTDGAFPSDSASGKEPAEYGYGLYHSDGTAKPAVASLSAVFSGQDVDTSFNNGFETPSDNGMPAGWLIWQPAQATFARDSAVAHSGDASVRISGSGGSGSAEPAFYLSPVTFIVPGATYNASVWARGAGATGVTRLSLAWFDTRGTYLSTDSSATLANGTTDWTQLSLTASAPAAAAYVEIHLSSAGNSGTAWFDDVSFLGFP